MGRRTGQLKVSFIENQKARHQTFKRRKVGVMTKIKELSTLCDVRACLVVFSPDHDAPTAPPSVWPPNDPAHVVRLIMAKNPKSKNGDDDGEKSQFGLFLDEKAEQIRAELERLKRFADQDQFFASTAMVMPAGGNSDDQLARELITDDAQQQEQDQLAHSNQFPEQKQQQFDLFGDGSSSVYQGDEDSLMMMMMMMDDAITADQSCCSSGIMAGFGFDEGASCSTSQIGGGDEEVAAVQDCNFYNDDDFTAQLYTPPMMTWQSTDEDVMVTQFQDNGAADYFDSIDFEDLWA